MHVRDSLSAVSLLNLSLLLVEDLLVDLFSSHETSFVVFLEAHLLTVIAWR